MPLKIYDVHNDEMREATQADIDALMAVQQAYGKLRTAVAQAHTELVIKIEEIKRREAQAANQPDFDNAEEAIPQDDGDTSA